MAEDTLFRVALIIAFAAFAPFGVYHRVRARTTERLDRWQEGVFILFGLRLSALPIAVSGIAWMINPECMAWSSIAIPTWLRWLGVGVVAFTGILVVWTFRSLGKNLTDTVVTRIEHTLVISGPYRFVRHPFYVAFGLGVLGVTLAMSNWLILLTGIIPLTFLVARTRIEERKLVERFGVEYENYMQRVGRFVPRFKL